MNQELHQKLLDSLQESIELHQQMIDSMDEMRRLVMLAMLLNTSIKDLKHKKVGHSVLSAGKRLKPWRYDKLIIRVDGEIAARLPLTEVPLDLWPRDTRDMYIREKHKKERRR